MEVFFPGSSATSQRFPLSFVELPAASTTAIGSLTVTPYPVSHASGAPAYALRIVCDGKVLAYSGDTEWTDALFSASSGAELFICEAYFYEKRAPFHLDCRTLLEHRAALGCQRLILTHMSADMLQHTADVDIERASDGLQVML